MQLSPNDIFHNRYRLVRRIGRGGFSVVWLAYDSMTDNTEVALKIYAPDKGMDDSGLRLFKREYTVTTKLNHAHLLKANHFDIYHDSPYLVMPYCRKGSLASMLNDKGSFTESEIARIISQIVSALAYLHGENVLHQDIKPDNILIDDRGNYLLTDFGISSRLRTTLQRSTTSAQSMTVAYAPPEKFRGSSTLTPAADIFSLAVMMYELLTGELPWNGMGGAYIRHDTELPELPGTYSKNLNALIQHCLQYEPEKRPDAQSLKLAADHFLQKSQWPEYNPIQQTVSSRKTITIEKTPPVSTPKKSKNPVKWIVLLLLLVVIGGGGYLWWEQEKERQNRVEQYNSLIEQADNQMHDKNFKEALNTYNNAKDWCDDCSLAEKGVQAANDSIQQHFDMLIAEGDQYLENNEFEKAKEKYLEAEVWSEDDWTADKAIEKVNTLKAANKAELAKQRQQQAAQQRFGAVTDIDGNKYKTVRIGNQVWMAENLRTSHYRNGDKIPNVASFYDWFNLNTGAWCWYDNDKRYEVPYGKIYNWYAVGDTRGLCPSGWKVPSNTEWTVLIDYLGGDEVAGGKMKSTGTQYWKIPNTDATNESGFSGLPGTRRDLWDFRQIGYDGSWWSSTNIGPENAWYRTLVYGLGTVHNNWIHKVSGNYVRCIKDN